MPTRPVLAPETQSTPAPGYCSEPARTPTTPRVYLCASGAGRGSSVAHVVVLQRGHRRRRQVEADVHEVYDAAGHAPPGRRGARPCGCRT